MTVRHLGTTYLVAGWVELVVILAAIALFAFLFVVWSFDPGHQTDWSKFPSLLLLGIACVAYPIPSIVAGHGLRRRTSWAYRWAWLATILHAINFPIGTLIASFGVLVLLKPEAKNLQVPGDGQGPDALGTCNDRRP